MEDRKYFSSYRVLLPNHAATDYNYNYDYDLSPYHSNKDTDLSVWMDSSNEAIYMTLSPLYYDHIDVSDVKKLESATKFIEKLKKTNPDEYQRLVNQTENWTKQQEEQLVNHSIYRNQNKLVTLQHDHVLFFYFLAFMDIPEASYPYLSAGKSTVEDYIVSYDRLELAMKYLYDKVLGEKNKENLDPSYFNADIKTSCLAFLKKLREKKPQAYHAYMRQKRDWLLGINFKVATTYSNHNALSNEEKFKKAEKDLLSTNFDQILQAVKQASDWNAKQITAIATKEKQQAAEYMAKSDYYKSNSAENGKLQTAKNEIANDEKNDLEKYRALMEKARNWASRQTLEAYIKEYIADAITDYQEQEASKLIAEDRPTDFMTRRADHIRNAKKEIENFKKTDLNKYYEIMDKTRRLVGPEQWDQQVKARTTNLQAWTTKYVKVDLEHVKKKQKTLLETINEAFARAKDQEEKLARFMVQRNTAPNPGELIGGNAIHAANEEEAKEIIEDYKLNKPDVYDDLVKRAGWHADYERKIYNLDYLNECNSPFQPTGSGTIHKEEKFAAWTMAMCRGPLGLYMESAFNGNTVIGEFSAAREKLVWSYGVRCVNYKPDAITVAQFLDKVKDRFQAKTNDKKSITLLVNGRGKKETYTYSGAAWKVGTCEIQAVFIKEDSSLREKDSPQYESGKEMIPVRYKVGA